MTATLGTTPTRPVIATCSRDVADRLGKRHDDVLKKIRNLKCDKGFASANFIHTTYIDAPGRSRPEYLITRDGLVFLVSSFNGAKAAAWKLEMIQGGGPLAADDEAPEAQQDAVPAVQQVDPAELVSKEMRTTSRQIAERFGKRHKNVMQAIRNMECSDEFSRLNFQQSPYVDEQNGQTYHEYQITRDGFSFLAMGFTGKRAAAWKELFIGAFNSMEERLRQPSMTQADVSMAVAQAMSAALPTLVEQTAKKVAEQGAPAAKRGSKARPNEDDLPRLKAENTFKAVAQRLGSTPEALHRFAELLRLIYRHGETGEWLPTERGLRSKMLKVRSATYERGEDKPDGQASYAVLTKAGALYLESLIANETKLLPDIEARLSSGRRISNAMARIWQRDVMESGNTQGQLPLH